MWNKYGKLSIGKMFKNDSLMPQQKNKRNKNEWMICWVYYGKYIFRKLNSIIISICSI